MNDRTSKQRDRVASDVDAAMSRLGKRVRDGKASPRQAETYRQALAAHRADPESLYEYRPETAATVGKVLYRESL